LWVAGTVFALLGGPRAGLESAVPPAGAPASLRLGGPLLGAFARYPGGEPPPGAAGGGRAARGPPLPGVRAGYFYAERLLDDAASFFLSPLMVISYKGVGYIGLVLFYAPLRMILESTRRQTEIRNAQRQLIHRERMAAKGEMAAEIAHELRNLL